MRNSGGAPSPFPVPPFRPSELIPTFVFRLCVVRSVKDTGDHREKKGLETFLSFERYRGIVDAHRVGLGEKEHASAVSKQVQQ